MITNPLVTVIIPCYEIGHLLSECVNSFLEQEFTNFEILIMDNYSQDETPSVAASFGDPRIRYIRNESNLGHIRNFNKGISLARGKYVWVMPGDDLLRSRFVLGRYVDVMERNNQVGYVFCRALELHGGEERGVGQWADLGDEDRIFDGPTFFLKLIEANCITASTVMVRKECYGKVGMYQPKLPFACDWYLWCMMAMFYDIAYCAEPMVCCRYHEKSLTSLYSHDYVKMCIGDQLGVLRLVASQANLAGKSSLRDACEDALCRRAARLLVAPFRAENPRMNSAEFEEMLQDRIQDEDGRKEVRARVYVTFADQLYSMGEFDKAAQAYRLAASARPWRFKIWTKYVLLSMGEVGIWIRKKSQRFRRADGKTSLG